MPGIFKSPYKYFFLFGLLVFLTTAFFSIGYYHVDEHFQILEFANYKLGNSPASDLAWEFQAKIRPALQPAMAILIIKALNIFNVSNPFTYSLILRIITALLSWFVISKTCLLLIKDFKTSKGKWGFLFISFFIWFIPYISVRFSSETYAAISFLGAVYLILKFNAENNGKKTIMLAIAGLLLGLSFFFRFQMGLAVLGLGLWLLVINKMNWKNILILFISGIAAIAFCIYLDYWFYGEFVITPFNYFNTNIIENKVSSFGVDPWWYYFELYFLKVIPPISIVLLVYFFIGLYKNPKHLFAWLIIPFVLVHFLIGHKELRFLFPMAFFFTYLAVIGFENFKVQQQFAKTVKFILAFSFVLNLFVLAYIVFTPSQVNIKYFQFLYNYSAHKNVVLLCKEKNPYELAIANFNFFKPKNLSCVVLKNDEEIEGYLETYQPDSILFLERNFTVDEHFEGYKSQTIYTAMPAWVVHFNYFDWISRSSIWKIQKLKRVD